MRGTECDRERDGLDAVSSGRWPDGASEELRAHVAACETCSDAVAVALALRDDRRALVRDARVLQAGLAWWRAERRAREEAARAATRPIALAHAAAVVCTGVAAATLLGLIFSWLPPWPGGAEDLISGGGAGTSTFPDVVSLGSWVLPIAVGLAAWLVLAPVAIYLSVTNG